MTTPPPPPPPYGQDPYQQPGPGQDPYQQPAAYPQPPTYQVSGPPQYPTSGPPQYPVSGGPQPYSPGPMAYPPGYAPPPGAYGFDPVTGQPYSDKSKVAAGLLQLLPGFLVALGGIGRLYAGQTTIGVVQLVVSILGWLALCCGSALSVFTFGLTLVIALPFLGGAWLWAVIDGIIMLAGRPTDGQGRPLRP